MIINKLRVIALLKPGLEQIEVLTDVPVLGVRRGWILIWKMKMV